MNVYVLNRRHLVFRSEGSGVVNVLLIPGREQIQVVRDIVGMADMPVHEAGVANKGLKLPTMSRSRIGMRYIYGHLIEEIVELKQSVSVWLAEDFVDKSCRAFFFVFSPDVIIHGIRESDDEGQLTWRTAQLPVAAEGYASLLDAVSDYVISKSSEGLVVAVYNQIDMYKKLQEDLSPYDIHPIPFTTLKPLPTLKPLYRHYDFTMVYMTLLLFGAIAFMACAGYLVYTMVSRNQIENQIEKVQGEIQTIQLNQNISQIRDPQSVLRAMVKAGNVEPSAIIDAAAGVAEPFGTLTKVTYQPPVLKEGDALPDVQTVKLSISGWKDKLLLDQENHGKENVQSRPWVRSIERTGAVGADGEVRVTLHVGQDALPVVSPTEPTVSTSLSVSVSSPAQGVSPVVLPTSPSSLVSSSSVSQSFVPSKVSGT